MNDNSELLNLVQAPAEGNGAEPIPQQIATEEEVRKALAESFRDNDELYRRLAK